MRSNACREEITTALQAVPGVRHVEVNLYRANVTIVHDPACRVSQLFRAMLSAGYNASFPRDKELHGPASAPPDGRRV
jgi:copper chaperone CopZ